MRRLSYPLSTIIFIETTFSSVEGVTTPTLKNAPSILSPVYRHYTHIVNTFSSIEGATTPKLKNAPSILSPPRSIFCVCLPSLYTHKDKTFSSVEGATTPTLKNAPSILSPVYHHSHIDNTFSSMEGATTPKLKKCAVYPILSLFLSSMFVHRHYTHIDNILQCRGGYYPNTEKCAAYPILSVPFFHVCIPSLYPDS